MCFTKRQGNNFDDQPASKKDIKKTATEPASEQTPTTAPATATPTALASTTPATDLATPAMAPKVAIVIYSMYGHIAKSESSSRRLVLAADF